ncbi:pancreatic triacylglycerol lipase-like [Agrilus planipennis]|uniref:Pancreatic triacylglycerol lipase-like n=1 Tax=Agrilus planipennis TaxID=224129 RepID=A0A1W4WM28_AGRPL|nr:pancreatic triacylglycerol lipase-like [Agrilus planipennis]
MTFLDFVACDKSPLVTQISLKIFDIRVKFSVKLKKKIVRELRRQCNKYAKMAGNASVFLQMIMYVTNQSAIQDDLQSSYNVYLMEIGKEMNKTTCIGSYGCFNLSAPWTSIHRPVSLFPENFEPNYFIYDRQHVDKPRLLDLEDYMFVKNLKINPDNPLYTISHGYLESGDKPWIIELAQELLKLEDCTVIAVDWGRGSSPPYTQAVANIRLVGAMTAHVLADFARFTGEKKLDHVHCIGHSLGAHLSGYIGYTLMRDFGLKLGRITGLDPAEPHFSKTQPPVRLDRSAAHYVDIIHTDASQFIRGGLGMTERIGHVDYYPNGGTDQPGCNRGVAQYITDSNGSFFGGIKKFLGCNHLRSHEYFMESIRSGCPFLTIGCSSYEDFKDGKCFQCGRNKNHCVRFGYHGREDYNRLIKKRMIRPNENLMQFLITGSESPFCKSHYRIRVEISNSTDSKTHGGEIGQLFFTVYSTRDGKGSNSGKMALNDGGYHEPGVKYEAVVPGNDIPDLKSVEVEWKYHSSVFNPLTWRLLASPRVFVDHVVIDNLETNKSIIVCSRENQPLISGIPQFFHTSYCALT